MPVRHYGTWVAAVVVLGLLVWLGTVFADADIKYGEIPDYLDDPNILKGVRNTLIVTFAAQGIGIVLGVLFAVMRLSRNPVLSGVAYGYIWFFRGTPVLVQLVFWFNIAVVFPTMFGQPTNELVTPFMAALLGLGLNEGAYMAEIVRAGIISVDTGQSEAASALGMTGGLTMRRIVLPQAMRVIVPPTGNELISMLKTSSLANVVLFDELFRAMSNIYSSNFLIFELLIVGSIWYLLLTTVATAVQYYVERYFARGSQHALPETPLQRLRRNLRPGRGVPPPSGGGDNPAALGGDHR